MKYRKGIGVFLCCCLAVVTGGCPWFGSKAEAPIDFIRVTGTDFLECMKDSVGACKKEKKEGSAPKSGELNSITLVSDCRETLDAILVDDKKQQGEIKAKEQEIEKQKKEFRSPDKEGIAKLEEQKAEFFSLSATPGGQSAMKALRSPTLQKIVNLFNYAAGYEQALPELEFDKKELGDFANNIQMTMRWDGFGQVHEKTKSLMRKTLVVKAEKLANKEPVTREESLIKEAESLNRLAAYLVAYTKAYFRNGRFAAVQLDDDAMKKFIAKQLEVNQDEQPWKDLLDDLVKKLPKAADGKHRNLFGKIEETSLKTRGGADYKFPAITATLQPGAGKFVTISKVDFVAVGADLIRVFLEALGDTVAGVPAMSDATGCNVQDDNLRLTAFDPKIMYLTEEDFADVNDFANRIEAATSVLVGRAIRGASWFSLNNESVAVLIETTTGVVAKKASEKILWCGYCVYRKDKEKRINYPLGLGTTIGKDGSFESAVTVKIKVK